MKKVLTILLILGSLLLVSCTSKNNAITRGSGDPSKAIIGTWDSKDYPGLGFTYVFEDGGTGTETFLQAHLRAGTCRGPRIAERGQTRHLFGTDEVRRRKQG